MNIKAMDSFGAIETKTREKGTPAFGIDLGTTNSAISVLRNGKFADIIPVGKYGVTLPSCVMWNGEDGFIVGEEAYANRYKENAIYSVKKLMGSGEVVTLRYDGKIKTMTPSEVSAEILKELVKRASVKFGDIKDVVISVPAHFNDLQIKDTIKAGELAGLNVMTMIKEPTAAAINYEDESEGEKDEVTLVYDLGGGTFDTTLLHISRTNDEAIDDEDDIYGFNEDNDDSESVANTVLKVIATDGDTKLGGDDIDAEMYNIFIKKVATLGYDITKISKADRENLKLQLEKLKKKGIGDYDVPVDFRLLDAESTRVKRTVSITGQDFYNAAEVVYRKTKQIIDRVLANAMVNITQMVLVGGSTKSEAIRYFLLRDYPDLDINYSLNPDESVALGAGIQAYRTKYGTKDVQVFDVVPLSIGVLSDGYITSQIEANTTIPYSSFATYKTNIDNQEVVSVAVYQGNSLIKEECTYLGHILVDNLPPKPAGDVKINVNLSIDARGVLKCSVVVEGQRVEKELVNLLKGNLQDNKPVNKIANRKLLRWKNFCNTLEGKDYNKLSNLLSQYESNPNIEPEIVNLIRDLRRKPELEEKQVFEDLE